MAPTQGNGKRTDRRVIRTRKAIMNAFDALICESDIEKITVSAIARKADIDRKTFYLHYKSIDDLANHKAEEAIEQMLERITTEGVGKSYLERIHIALMEVNAIITSNIPLYSKCASHVSTEQVLARISRVAKPATTSSKMNPELTFDNKLYMKLQFFVAGAIYLYSSWLRSDRQVPIEAVSDTIEEAIATEYRQETQSGF